MKGTDKQRDFAESIIDTLTERANATLAEAAHEAGTKEAVSLCYRQGTARQQLAEMTVIAAVEAGDLTKAEALFADCERADLVAGLIDGTEISAARVIDTYKKSFYAKEA
jgi:beta-lactamase regulating signal transducer with metallopeptidase domain